jgi:hypothetical protein
MICTIWKHFYFTLNFYNCIFNKVFVKQNGTEAWKSKTSKFWNVSKCLLDSGQCLLNKNNFSIYWDLIPIQHKIFLNRQHLDVYCYKNNTREQIFRFLCIYLFYLERIVCAACISKYVYVQLILWYFVIIIFNYFSP